MRAAATFSIVTLILLAARAAVAAPTCWNLGGETVRCEAAGALPVGSPRPPGARPARAVRLSAAALAGLGCTLAGLFALIALMPDFEGWDRTQE